VRPAPRSTSWRGALIALRRHGKHNLHHVEGALVHLQHHDVSLVTISRAPLDEIESFKKRMGWSFLWLSSYRSDFNYDYQASFKPEEVATGRVTYNYEVRDFVSEERSGLSVFYKNAGGEIFHTYSTFGRGDEMVDTTYMYLDLTPKGRNENGPHYSMGDWVRHHDRYEAAGFVDAAGRFVAEHSDSGCGCGHEGVNIGFPLARLGWMRSGVRDGGWGGGSGPDCGRGLSF
jgi:hypothetical protein